MISELIKIIVFMIISFLTIFIVNKTTKIKKQKIILFVVILSFLIIIISLIETPLINYFTNFKTPEKAFNFVYDEEIIDIVEGEESCMIVYKEDNNNFGQDYILKSEKEYKILNNFSLKKVANTIDEKGSFNIFNINGTNDYYIIGLISTYEESLNIISNDNKKIQYIVINELITADGKKVKTVFLYGIINNFTDDYYLMINDKQVVF